MNIFHSDVENAMNMGICLGISFSEKWKIRANKTP